MFQSKECSFRYKKAQEHDKVYCSDGIAHLIEYASVNSDAVVVCFL